MSAQADAAGGKQSRRMSLLEGIANVLVGYAVALLMQVLVFPMFRLRTSLTDDLVIALVFTLVSLARSYALRRLFEAIRVSAQPTRPAQP